MITTMQQLLSYLQAFEHSQKQAQAHNQEAWLRGVREDAFARFCELGFPTVHEEDWRFTNVAPIAQSTSGSLSADSTESTITTLLLTGWRVWPLR